MSPWASTAERPVSITCVTPWSRGFGGRCGRSRKSGTAETLASAMVATMALMGRGRKAAAAVAAAAALVLVVAIVSGGGGGERDAASQRPPGGPVSLVWGGGGAPGSYPGLPPRGGPPPPAGGGRGPRQAELARVHPGGTV